MTFAGIVCGLGNPGSKYSRSRHNCGFMFIDALLDAIQKKGAVEILKGKKFHAEIWKIQSPQLEGIWLAVKPQTYMNESGIALRPLLAGHKLSPSQLVVAQDELDLPPGALRFKCGGGLAGHNGLASIVQQLGSRDFYRLRIGIGHPFSKEDMLGWVLGKPALEDHEKIKSAINESVKIFFDFTKNGFDSAKRLANSFTLDLK